MCNEDAISKYPNWLTRGALGCALSHYYTYKKIIEDDVESALVLEDDAILPNGFGDLLGEIAKHLNKNEVVLLFYLNNSEELKLSRESAIPLNNDFKLFSPCSLEGIASTVAYIITNDAARTLSDFNFPIWLVSDSWTNFIRANAVSSIRFVYPRPVSYTFSKSTITTTFQSSLRAKLTTFVDDYRAPIFFQILRFLRRSSINARSKVILSEEPPVRK